MMCGDAAMRGIDRSRSGKLRSDERRCEVKHRGFGMSLSNYLLDLYTGLPYPLCWDWVSATVACLSDVSAWRYLNNAFTGFI